MSFYILDILYAECKNDRYFRSSTHRRKTSLKLTCANLLSKKYLNQFSVAYVILRKLKILRNT